MAGNDSRVLLARGDRAYARGERQLAAASKSPARSRPSASSATRRRSKDPATGEILGYEAQYLGKAQLQRGESTAAELATARKSSNVVPATIDIVAAREEMRAGDRLLPEPPRQLLSYTPRAPEHDRSTAASSRSTATRCSSRRRTRWWRSTRALRDGIESGHVLAILKNGDTIVDQTGGGKETLKLPNERIGLLMVFRPFERVSYALVLEINDTPRVGDLLVNP